MERCFILRGLILSKYKSLCAFSEASGIKTQRVYKLSEGHADPTKKEMLLLKDHLDLSVEEAWELFFNRVVAIRRFLQLSGENIKEVPK